MTEDERVRWHHRLDGHESEQAPGNGEGQGGPACCGPWGRKEPDTSEQQQHSVIKRHPVCLTGTVCVTDHP